MIRIIFLHSVSNPAPNKQTLIPANIQKKWDFSSSIFCWNSCFFRAITLQFVVYMQSDFDKLKSYNVKGLMIFLIFSWIYFQIRLLCLGKNGPLQKLSQVLSLNPLWHRYVIWVSLCFNSICQTLKKIVEIALPRRLIFQHLKYEFKIWSFFCYFQYL